MNRREWTAFYKKITDGHNRLTAALRDAGLTPRIGLDRCSRCDVLLDIMKDIIRDVPDTPHPMATMKGIL